MPLTPLPPGSPFPEISATFTDVWVEFWNVVFKSWADNLSGGTGSASGWPTSFTLNGRILETDPDTLSARTPGSPALAVILPVGGKWILDGELRVLEDDVTIGDISPVFTGWIVPVATYDEEFDVLIWTHEEYETRPALGTGVACKVETSYDRINTLTITEDECDVIPTLPIILARMRLLSGGGSGTGAIYLKDLFYSVEDPRDAQTVIEEKLAALVDMIQVGADREAPSEVDKLWEYSLGLTRGLEEIAPRTLRFLNVGSARPGIYGTDSAPDGEVYDLGGTLPEDPDERSYHV